jgi:OpgC protein
VSEAVFLGQHSLQVFSWSVGMTYLAFLSGESWRHLHVPTQTFLAVSAVVSLWVSAWLHSIWKNRAEFSGDPRIRSIASA